MLSRPLLVGRIDIRVQRIKPLFSWLPISSAVDYDLWWRGTTSRVHPQQQGLLDLHPSLSWLTATRKGGKLSILSFKGFKLEFQNIDATGGVFREAITILGVEHGWRRPSKSSHGTVAS